jgi:protein dithiol oxidoreductase (disulfide-forming)
MKRRDFSLTCGAFAGAAVLPSVVLAQGKPFQAGDDYLAVKPAATVEAPAGKIEVVEFFWYNCPHCNAFEPTLEAWVKRLPADVVMRKVPIAFQDSFIPQQRLYYALESMGLVEKLHSKVFAAIHAEHQKLDKEDAIIAWVASQGVDKAKFTQQFNSFSVVTKTKKATLLQNAYGVEGVPALGVAGRFYTDGTLAKGIDRALLVVESLVAQVRSGR